MKKQKDSKASVVKQVNSGDGDKDSILAKKAKEEKKEQEKVVFSPDKEPTAILSPSTDTGKKTAGKGTKRVTIVGQTTTEPLYDSTKKPQTSPRGPLKKNLINSERA